MHEVAIVVFPLVYTLSAKHIELQSECIVLILARVLYGGALLVTGSITLLRSVSPPSFL